MVYRYCRNTELRYELLNRDWLIERILWTIELTIGFEKEELIHRMMNRLLKSISTMIGSKVSSDNWIYSLWMELWFGLRSTFLLTLEIEWIEDKYFGFSTLHKIHSESLWLSLGI